MHSLQQILLWTGAQLAGADRLNRLISELCIDSRSVGRPEAALFIALRTAQRDGHAFIAEAYAKGIRAFLVSDAATVKHFPDASFLFVSDTLTALQAVAAAVRDAYAGLVIGITGSNGKTVVKEWLHVLLSEEGQVLRSPRSYNSQVGVPLSVWPLLPTHRAAIIEAGISLPGEMARLEAVVRPTHGIFTHLGEAHSEGFETLAQKADEKMQLFRGAQHLVYCRDQEEVHAAVLRAFPAGGPQLFAWSWAEEDAGLRLLSSEVREADGVTALAGSHAGHEHRVVVPFIDEASVENAIHCWATMLLLGYAPDVIARRIAALQPVAMRLESRRALGGSTLINDAYNADLTSLRIALDHLGRQRQHPRHTLVLTDLQQTGLPDAELYREVAALLQHYPVQRLLAVGPAISAHGDAFATLHGMEAHFFPDTDALLKALPSLRPENEAVLLKGARAFALERVAAALEEAVHTTVLSIDLTAMAHNFSVYRALLKPGVKTMAMVKALAYGSGTYEVAQVLEAAGCDYLAVAYPDEGIALRRAGITLPIMVMSPDAAAADRMMRWSLEPEVYNLALLRAFQLAAEAIGLKEYPIHIKLDTGMHRLGFGAEGLDNLIAALRDTDRLRIASVFSHLAGSEDAAFDDFTAAQASAFEKLSTRLVSAFAIHPLRHLANSAAVTRHPSLHYDMVRLGLGLYGIDGSGKLQKKLRPISTLKSTIAQIRTVPAGETVGYGRRGRAEQPSRIATVRIGYADGYPRALSPAGGYMLVRGRKAPLFGAVCMDLCMIDVTGIPAAREGDEVIVFGPKLPVQQLATWAGTIPYEIMTGISARVKRVYVAE